MQEYTVMIFRDHSSPVRRYKVARQRLQRLALAVGIALALVAIVFVDYVRVRSDIGELEALRGETAHQQSEIEHFTQKLGELEDRFVRLNEFERKVRVIANLPAAASDADPAVPPSGVGGGQDDEENGIVSEAPPAAASRAAFERDPSLPAPSDWFLDLDGGATRLLDAAALRVESYADLVEALRSKSDQLASTPSVWPVRGWVTSGFGRRFSPFTGKSQMHSGLDIAAERGSAIVAPARGRVSFVGRKGALGKAVEIDHGFGVKTLYGHCETIHVKPGQRVERGQWVAAIGNTGRSTGPHLHYAVQVKGQAVDPREYILD